LINASLNLQKQFPKRKIVIVTKDLGLRLRSSAWQCDSQNYKSDLLEDEIYKGVQYIDITSDDEWNLLSGNLEIETKQLSIQLKLNPNEFVIFSYKEKQIACRYLNGKLKILKNGENCNGNSKKPLYMGISPKNLEQRCALDILSDDSISLVSLAGSAGVGKTILALAVALQKINEGVYDKMVIMKPIIPVGGRDLGALPGDKWEKLSSWLGPYKDNIAQLMSTGDNGTPDIEDFIKDGLIEVEAMTYIQGRSIPNSIIIVDEAENITNREARMVVERCAQGSKVILLGDLSQVENPFLDSRSCGLAHSMNGGKNMVSCASITLSKVERSSLAAIASEIFSSPEARR
jgi:PhoH-like ATPase